MACVKPPKGARLGNEGPMGDTMCNVKSAEFLTSSTGHEAYKTEVGKWYEGRREIPLCSQVDELQKELPQGVEEFEEIDRKSRAVNSRVFDK